MAKQRYTQFFRNASVQYYADYQTAVAAIKSTFKNNKSSLKDGEFILGRYGFPGSGTTPSEGKEITHGVVVGVARRSGNDVYLDFLADENYVQFAISNGLAGFDLAATTVGTLNTSESSSTLTLYNVSQENGQVSVGTTSNTLDVVMAGQYNASNNRVALESTVTNAIGSITSSEMILGKSADVSGADSSVYIPAGAVTSNQVQVVGKYKCYYGTADAITAFDYDDPNEYQFLTQASIEALNSVWMDSTTTISTITSTAAKPSFVIAAPTAWDITAAMNSFDSPVTVETTWFKQNTITYTRGSVTTTYQVWVNPSTEANEYRNIKLTKQQ